MRYKRYALALDLEADRIRLILYGNLYAITRFVAVRTVAVRNDYVAKILFKLAAIVIVRIKFGKRIGLIGNINRIQIVISFQNRLRPCRYRNVIGFFNRLTNVVRCSVNNLIHTDIQSAEAVRNHFALAVKFHIRYDSACTAAADNRFAVNHRNGYPFARNRRGRLIRRDFKGRVCDFVKRSDPSYSLTFVANRITRNIFNRVRTRLIYRKLTVLDGNVYRVVQAIVIPNGRFYFAIACVCVVCRCRRNRVIVSNKPRRHAFVKRFVYRDRRLIAINVEIVL